MTAASTGSARRWRHGPVPTMAILVVLAAIGSAAAAPFIERIEPPGSQVGGEVTVSFRGRELEDPEELRFADRGIAVRELIPGDNGRFKARLAIDADCPPGAHAFRLRTRDGLSELRTFRVGILPQIDEKEPNNDPAAAQEVVLPRTVAGVVRPEDVDCFRVRLAANARISIAIDAMRLNQQMFDPYVDIVDARGFVVASCDDHPLLGPDSMFATTVKEAGDYVVRVRESAYGGNDGCLYLLHLGDFPVPHVAWPPVGRPGTTVDVQWLGDPAGPFRSPAVLPAIVPPSGLAEIHPVRDGVASPVGVPMRVSALATVSESEPNDEPARATAATAPTALLARMDSAEDVDWFRVTAPKGSRWHVRAWGRRLGAPIDLVLNAHRDDAKRERITGNDDTDGPDSVMKVNAPAEGSFLVRVNDHLRRGGGQFVYWIEVVPADPEVLASMPAARQNGQDRFVAAVPRGNRTAIALNLTRSDFSGPVAIALAGLPAGVRATAFPAAANAPSTAVLFEADPTAELAAAEAGVDVTAAEDGRRLGSLLQASDMVMGQGNNGSYRKSYTDTLPVAVVEDAPIRIEVDEPQVPLVRRGVLDLRVRVERLDGYEGAVSVSLPFKPPGIGAAATVEIPADKSEGSFQLNGNADAAAAEWKLVLVASPVKKGEEKKKKEGKRRRSALIQVASQPFTLRVAEPLVELAADKAVVEQGAKVEMVWKLRKPATFAGVAKARLMGLPSRVESPEIDLAAGAAEISFPVTVASDAIPGPHTNVFCQVRVPHGESWVIHNMPPTQLRIDKPLPPDDREARP